MNQIEEHKKLVDFVHDVYVRKITIMVTALADPLKNMELLLHWSVWKINGTGWRILPVEQNRKCRMKAFGIPVLISQTIV